MVLLGRERDREKEKLKYGCIYSEKENWDEEVEWKSDGNRGWKLKSDDMMMIKTIILRVLKILVGLILYKKHRGTVE